MRFRRRAIDWYYFGEILFREIIRGPDALLSLHLFSPKQKKFQIS